MSGASTVATIAAVAAVAGTGAAIYNGIEQKKSANHAADQAKQAADQQAVAAAKRANQAEQDVNRANQKKPDVGGILSAAQQAGKAGASGTMLTGPQGIDPGTLQLGKNTLLGQ